MNKAHVIEITKACSADFMKARNSLVVRCRERERERESEKNRRWWVEKQKIWANIKNMLMVQQSCLWLNLYQMDFMRR